MKDFVKGKIYQEKLKEILIFINEIKNEIPEKNRDIINSLEQEVSTQLKQFDNIDCGAETFVTNGYLALKGFELTCKFLSLLKEPV